MRKGITINYRCEKANNYQKHYKIKGNPTVSNLVS